MQQPGDQPGRVGRDEPAPSRTTVAAATAAQRRGQRRRAPSPGPALALRLPEHEQQAAARGRRAGLAAAGAPTQRATAARRTRPAPASARSAAARRRTGSTRTGDARPAARRASARRRAPRRRRRPPTSGPSSTSFCSSIPGTTSSSTATTASEGTARGSAVPSPGRRGAGPGRAPRPCRSSGRSPGRAHRRAAARPGPATTATGASVVLQPTRPTRPHARPRTRREGVPACRSGRATRLRAAWASRAGRAERSLSGSGQIAVAMAVMNVATYGFTMLGRPHHRPERVRRLRRPDEPAAGHQRRAARPAGHRRPTHLRRPAARRARSSDVDPAASRYRRPLGARRCPAGADPADQRACSTSTASSRPLLVARRGGAADHHGRPGRHPPGRAALGARWPCSTSPPGCRGCVDRHRADPVAADRVHARCSASAIGFYAPVLVGWWALRHQRHAGEAGDRAQPAPVDARGESSTTPRPCSPSSPCPTSTSSSPATCSTDHDAGLYAGGLILTKAVLFLPQFVVVVASRRCRPARAAPRPGRAAWRSSRPSARSCALGAAGCCPASRLVFVGGAEFGEVERPALALRAPRHAARDDPAAGLLRARPPGHAVGAASCGWPWSR